MTGLRVLSLALALAAVPLAAVPLAVSAQGTCPPGVPPGVFCGERNIAHAEAGTYTIDPDHAAVFARVSHIGYSYSVFRFDKVAGTLNWDPANVAGSKVTASVKTESITSNVKGFASELAGPAFLNAPRFPEIAFVSTAFRQAGATLGTIEGQLTLLGKTAPVTFEVSLVGAGKGFGGQPRLGVHASGWIKPQEFAMPVMFTDPIEIVMDIEFVRNK